MIPKYTRILANLLAAWVFLGIGFTWFLSLILDEPQSPFETFLPLCVLLSAPIALFLLVLLTRKTVKGTPMDPKRWRQLRLRCLSLGPIGCAMTVHELTKEKDVGQDTE